MNLRCLLWQLLFTSFLLSGLVCRYAECCPLLLSFTCFQCTILLLLLLPLLWILIAAPSLFPPGEEAGFNQDILSVTVSETIYRIQSHIYVVLNVSGLCIMQRLMSSVCVECTGSVGTKRKLDENNDDESLHQQEEGTKDAWKTVWWTAVKTVKALLMQCGITFPECQCF